jgi:hypothetical protein
MKATNSLSGDCVPAASIDSADSADAAGNGGGRIGGELPAGPRHPAKGGEKPTRAVARRVSSSLSVPQCRALETLMSGQTVWDAAEAAGVGRTTFYRWMNEDAGFRAAYNAWRRDMAEATHGSILALTEPAVRAVAAALEKGDVKTAMVLLKSLGLLKPQEAGSTDVESVKKEQEIARKKEETKLFWEDMEAGMPG